ncbi:Uu.00g104120.m01.CDS01 [Anthostomella pinea]|uniref:Uu.00g104120.m01.CDS01 n=1 Tax=Anthostomella pinea TaxID=933095 RepID=A0AAI8VDR4_9PEZI|nr:Uu.00g104120.m01.CDS01 [Anthostomella pinea]
MVEVFRVPSLGHHMSSSPDIMEMSSRFMNANLSSIQEHHEQTGGNMQTGEGASGIKNGGFRAPRRALSVTESQFPAAPVSRAIQTQQRLLTPSPSPREQSNPEADSYFQLQNQTAITSIPTSTPTAPKYTSSQISRIPSGRSHQAAQALPQRPSMPSPQRSYSVMDFEPIPFTHQPGSTLTLPDLPPELHYAIFDYLDPIDSTCLGLTSKHFYAVHHHMHGAVSLGARREGPNDMEWVWRHAGPFVFSNGTAANSSNKQNSLAMLSPRGQVYCRKCRTQRCELHNHIKEWMGGDAAEYCGVTQKFGAPARIEGAKGFCHRSSPRHPHRCGRHTRQQRTVRLV